MPFRIYILPKYLIRATIVFLFSAGTILGQSSTAPIRCGFAEGNLANSSRKATEDRPQLSHSLVSNRGWFRIHYDTGGINAIDVTDTLADGTPRFPYEAGIAADSAYSLLVNQMGFLPPVSDNGVDGPELDLYIIDWSHKQSGIYGMTYFSGVGSPVFLEIDNNYAESIYATHGMDALHVTVVHEFFHMIQVRYSAPTSFTDPAVFWYEMSSTWFEEKAYPEVNDYIAYLGGLFTLNPGPALNSASYMYAQGLFCQMLDKEYGYNSSHLYIMVDLWQHLGTQDPIDNLRQVLKSGRWGHSSLEDALSLYGLYNSFTGSRAIPGRFYSDASLFPTIPYSSILITPGLRRTDSYSVPRLSIFYNRYLISGSGEVIISNTTPAEIPTAAQLAIFSQDRGALVKGTLERNLYISCDTLLSQDYLLLPTGNSSGSSSQSMQVQIADSAIYYSPKLQRLFPNPILGSDPYTTLDLVISKAGVLSVTLYDLLGREVSKLDVNEYEGLRQVRLGLPNTLAAGIYFLRIDAPANRYFRKITILK